MIKITYEYSCDVCGVQIREPEKFTHHPQLRSQAVPMAVSTGDVVGPYHVCEHCLTEALKGMLPDQAK